MSEKRIRRPAKGGQKGSAASAATPAPEAGGFDWDSYFDSLFGPIFRAAIEREAAEERARQARPKAQIIPFPKARDSMDGARE